MNDYFPQDNGIGVRIGNGVKQVDVYKRQVEGSVGFMV